MDFKKKLDKIRGSDIKNAIQTKDNDKTGILNGLLLLGAAMGTLLSLEREVSGAGTSCIDTVNQKVTDTGNAAIDSGLTILSWDDHHWHNHNWWDHCWHDFSQYTDTGGGTA